MESPTKSVNHNEEIDFRVLLLSLWKHKVFILLVTFISVLIALTYLAFKKPIYQVQANILPPGSIEIESLNNGHRELNLIDTKLVYEIFTNILTAESTKVVFFKSDYLPALSAAAREKIKSELLYKQFKKAFTLKEIPRSNPAQYLMIVRGTDANQVFTWANQFIDKVNSLAITRLSFVIKQQQQNILQDLQQKINTAREIAKDMKQAKLAQLNEALKIAQAAGIDTPFTATSGGVIVTMAKLDEPSFMYTRGIKALTAEIQNITSRTSDDLFVPKLFQLQNKYSNYKNLAVNLDNFHMFSIDGELTKPGFSVAPRKSLVLLLATILGLLVGVGITVIREGFKIKI